MNCIRSTVFVAAAAFSLSAYAQATLPLFAADSLRPALDEVAAAYPAARVQVQYGNPVALRDRIAAGERPALFASANVDYPHSLTLQGLAGPVKRFARDRNTEFGLVLVDGSSEEAWYFAQFILSPEGQAILAKHGFARGGSALAVAR
jgi:ABC-type molybdate transport system substrate-binding protein